MHSEIFPLIPWPIKCEKYHFGGNLIDIPILVLSFSTESAEKPTIYDLLYLAAKYYPKNNNKHPSEMRN